MLVTGALLLLVTAYPLMARLQTTHPTAALVMQSPFCLFVAIFAAVAPSALAEVFPTAVRASGMSISYNTAVTILGGFAPAILTWISYTTKVAHAPALYVMAAMHHRIGVDWIGWSKSEVVQVGARARTCSFCAEGNASTVKEPRIIFRSCASQDAMCDDTFLPCDFNM